MSKSSRKTFPLRINQQLFAELRAWADQEMRSVNGQIEYLLRDAVRRRHVSSRGKAPSRSTGKKLAE